MNAKDRITDLDAQISILTKEREALIKQQLIESCGISIGDTIEWNCGRGVVLDVTTWVSDKPKFSVRRILKNGSTGAVCTIYAYDEPRKVI